ncbi:MAG: hypothetical protein NTX79_08760 [Candidatus Micrarchaeota archaeon]|nr:hypothetical protein [Candidatus Micrarchaeota archaeon]
MKQELIWNKAPGDVVKGKDGGLYISRRENPIKPGSRKESIFLSKLDTDDMLKYVRLKRLRTSPYPPDSSNDNYVPFMIEREVVYIGKKPVVIASYGNEEVAVSYPNRIINGKWLNVKSRLSICNPTDYATYKLMQGASPKMELYWDVMRLGKYPSVDPLQVRELLDSGKIKNPEMKNRLRGMVKTECILTHQS